MRTQWLRATGIRVAGRVSSDHSSMTGLHGHVYDRLDPNGDPDVGFGPSTFPEPAAACVPCGNAPGGAARSGGSLTMTSQALLTPPDLADDAPLTVLEQQAPNRIQQWITALILVAPFVGVLIAVIAEFGKGVTLLDLLLFVGMYAISGHGVTAGFHRMMTHRGFVAKRGTKIVLAVAGSLAFEGAAVSWAANHRRHHAYTDVPGDPHSPHLDEHASWPRLRGAIHAHVGWLFVTEGLDITRWAPDLEADRDLSIISQLFPVFCVVSLGLPTLIGWAVTGSMAGAVGGLVWGGLVRIFVLQHATFAVNSACHIWGKRPFRTRRCDRATNFAPLAIFSMGENWHNLHHSNPTFARHGVDRGQLDSTACLIRFLELTGRISGVHWPCRDSVACRRLPSPSPPRERRRTQAVEGSARC